MQCHDSVKSDESMTTYSKYADMSVCIFIENGDVTYVCDRYVYDSICMIFVCDICILNRWNMKIPKNDQKCDHMNIYHID